MPISPTQGPTGGGTVVTITGTNLGGATVVRFGTKTAAITANTPTSVTAVTPSGAGAVPVTVTTTGGTSNPISFYYVGLPSKSALSAVAGAISGGNTITLTGSGLSTATAVHFGTGTAVPNIVSDRELTVVVPAGGAAGTVGVSVTAAGGTNNGLTYTYVAVPVLTAIAPTSGSTAGGTSIVLTGTGFTGATAVRFGTTAVPFILDSATQITATAPAGTGTVTVTVTTPGGTSNGRTYTYNVAPTLSSVAPTSGTSAGGTSVVLTGTGFTGATAVRFGATAATSFTVDSSTQITAVAPAGTDATSVTVTAPGGTSNGLSYTYVAVPTLTTLAPTSGAAAGGTTVVVTGTGFTGATAVRFGATAAPFLVNSSTQITVISPAGTGTTSVTVTTPGGTSNGLTYTYVAAPTLSSLSPVAGLLIGGNTVTITGTGFTGATAVTFGTTPATFTVNSSTQIRATAPAGPLLGTASVTVTTPGGTSNGLTYTYI